MPTGSLPASGKKLWEEVYETAKKGSCKDNSDPEACAAGSAWKAVKNAGWSKDSSGQWHKKAELTEFSMAITKASFDKGTQEMRWLASASDTQEDSYNDNMTLGLFEDFLGRIEENELAPEDFRSDFWQGGMPYLSISHYPDFNGTAVPGDVEVTYVDGDYLKAKGTYRDTALGRACFKAICDDLYNTQKSDHQDRVRISIAFLDWAHKHKSNEFLFERKSLEDFCPECLRELIQGEYAGKEYLKGQLVHYAHTRVPVNKRTVMEVDKSMTTRKEDAATIVGDELAEELEEKNKSLVGKSEALVIKAEDEEKVSIPVIEEAKHKGKEDDEYDEKAPDDEEDMEEEHKKKKKMMKSEASDEVLETVRSLVEGVIGLKVDIAQLKAVVMVEPSVHPLHESLEKFQSDYDAALEMADLSSDEKLRLIQQSFDALGQNVIETIKTPKAITEPNSAIEMAKAFSDALQPIMQQLGMLSAEINALKSVASVDPNNPSPPIVPKRRSITPTLQMQSVIRSGASQSVTQSETPKLRAIIERTT